MRRRASSLYFASSAFPAGRSLETRFRAAVAIASAPASSRLPSQPRPGRGAPGRTRLRGRAARRGMMPEVASPQPRLSRANRRARHGCLEGPAPGAMRRAMSAIPHVTAPMPPARASGRRRPASQVIERRRRRFSIQRLPQVGWILRQPAIDRVGPHRCGARRFLAGNCRDLPQGVLVVSAQGVGDRCPYFRRHVLERVERGQAQPPVLIRIERRCDEGIESESCCGCVPRRQQRPQDASCGDADVAALGDRLPRQRSGPVVGDGFEGLQDRSVRTPIPGLGICLAGVDRRRARQ